ncbi:tolB protein-like protein [Perilla frutescens var. hirtella]|nr:tolB protein-like protein [Perilla frutescens var. hirtella]
MIVYISERIGSARIFLSRSSDPHPKQLHTAVESLFHNRPTIKNARLYFISAHEPPDKPFTSWLALYAATLGEKMAE